MAGRANGARLLHKVKAMKSIVGILAAGLFLGCGVGVDDLEGQAAAFGTLQQAIAAGAGGVGTTAVGGEPLGAALGTPDGQRAGNRGAGESSSGSSAAGVELPTGSADGTYALGGGTVQSPQDPIPAFDPLNPPLHEEMPFPPGDPRPLGL